MQIARTQSPDMRPKHAQAKAKPLDSETSICDDRVQLNSHKEADDAKLRGREIFKRGACSLAGATAGVGYAAALMADPGTTLTVTAPVAAVGGLGLALSAGHDDGLLLLGAGALPAFVIGMGWSMGGEIGGLVGGAAIGALTGAAVSDFI